MVVEEVIVNSGDALTGVIFELGKIGLWVQAIGWLVIFWFIIQIVNFILSRKKRKALYRMSEKLDKIDKKLDKLVREKNALKGMSKRNRARK